MSGMGTGGKTRCEYMFSELPQIADIVGAAGREDCLKPLFSVERLTADLIELSHCLERLRWMRRNARSSKPSR